MPDFILNVENHECGVLVGGTPDVYDVVDVHTDQPITILDTSHVLEAVKHSYQFQIDTIKKIMADLNNPRGKLDIDSFAVKPLEEPEIALFLEAQHTNKYKPFLVSFEGVKTEIMTNLAELVEKSASSKETFKIDFVYYDAHCLPFSLRVEDGKIHVISVDYVQYNNIVIDHIFKTSESLKDKFVYHYFSPEKQMQTDGVSCAVFAAYALKELSHIPTQDLDKYVPVNTEI